MPSKRLFRVALLIESHRSYSRDLLTGVRRWMDQNERWSTFIEIGGVLEKPPPWLENWDGHGIISRSFTKGMAETIQSTGLPCVELRATRFGQNCPFVGMDNSLIGQKVAEHFLNRGYRNFGVYSLDTEEFFQERVRNFVKSVESRGYRSEVLPAGQDHHPESWEDNQNSLIHWLTSLPKPVGVFATNDQLGVRVLDACQRADIPVPEEVAVVGTENDETLCAFASPPLTSLRFDGIQAGYKAAEILQSMMDGNNKVPHQTLIPPGGIVVRASSDDLVINDPVVARAARLIRENALDHISVDDVCHTLHVSRSTLERRMKKALGRTPKNEIQRIRFREVERLLLETELTIDAIAELTGFTHTEYFHAAFQERYHMTPTEFRKPVAG
ncbi:MAG: DNA-binding transcriptional regulator [Verrucomicrobiales bacterium]|nr:DNA-binding transcriptional regulator [Verrucomicrobiales bacterium]